MPRWDDPSIIGQPDQTPEHPPTHWSGWRPEPEHEHSGQVLILMDNQRAAMAASARRHPAFGGLDRARQDSVINSLFDDHRVSDLRRHISGNFGR